MKKTFGRKCLTPYFEPPPFGLLVIEHHPRDTQNQTGGHGYSISRESHVL